MALDDAEKANIVATVQAEVVKDIKKSGNLDILPPPASAPKEPDPYRPMLQFLVGLLAFCLTLIVGLFAALGADKGHAVNTLVVSVLVGMVVTAGFGTVAALLLQWEKSKGLEGFKDVGTAGAVSAVLAVVAGVLTVVICVDGALKLADKQCIAKPADGMGEQALTDLLEKFQGAESRAYAEARARDCFAAGDLVSSAAWSKIASPAKP